MAAIPSGTMDMHYDQAGMLLDPLEKNCGFLPRYAKYELFGFFLRIFYATYIGFECESAYVKFSLGESRGTEAYSPIRHNMTAFVIHNIFQLFFMADSFFRVYYAGFWKSLNNTWNTMELVITVGSGFYIWIWQIALYTRGIGTGIIHVLAVLPIFRVARIQNAVMFFDRKSLQSGNGSLFTSLILILNGLGNAFRALFWAFLTMAVMLYVTAIITTLQIGHKDNTYNDYYLQSGWDHEIYFRDVPTSMLTLFQIVTRDKWAEGVVRHIAECEPMFSLFFPVFMLLTTYGLCYMVIGILVDSILQCQRENKALHIKKQKASEKKTLQSLKESFARLDENNDGTLTLQELSHASEYPDVRARLQAINFPVDSPEEFFETIDIDGEGEVELEDFLTNCVRLSGSCKSKDMLEAEKLIEGLGRCLANVEDRILESRKKIEEVEQRVENVYLQGPRIRSDIKAVKTEDAAEKRKQAANWTDRAF